MKTDRSVLKKRRKRAVSKDKTRKKAKLAPKISKEGVVNEKILNELSKLQMIQQAEKTFIGRIKSKVY